MKNNLSRLTIAATILLWAGGAALAYRSSTSGGATPSYHAEPSTADTTASAAAGAVTATYPTAENDEALFTMQGYMTELDSVKENSTAKIEAQTSLYEAVFREAVNTIQTAYSTAINGIQNLIDTFYPQAELPDHASEGESFYLTGMSEMENAYTQARDRMNDSNVAVNEDTRDNISGYLTLLDTAYDTYRGYVAVMDDNVSSLFLPQLQTSRDTTHNRLQALLDSFYWTYQLPAHSTEAETLYTTGVTELESIYTAAAKMQSAPQDNENALATVQGYQTQLRDKTNSYVSSINKGSSSLKDKYNALLEGILSRWDALLQGLIDSYYGIVQLHEHLAEAGQFFADGSDELTSTYNIIRDGGYDCRVSVEAEGDGVLIYSGEQQLRDGTASYYEMKGYGAVFHFVPDSSCQLQSVMLDGTQDITAQATNGSYSIDSLGGNVSVKAVFTIAVADMPVITVSEADTTVSITCATDGAAIYYTTDGTDPTDSSNAYSAPFRLAQNCTIKAVAVLKNRLSTIASQAVGWLTVSDVTFSYAALRLTMATTTDGAAIHYTTDGSDPTAASSLYTVPIELDGQCTVKAIAIREGWNSSQVTSYSYDPAGVTCGNPVLARVEGTNVVTASTSTEGAFIHYTTDGTEPTANSGTFPEGGLTVERNMTIKAIALRDNWYPSQVTTFTVDWFKVVDVEFAQEGNTVVLTTLTDGATIHYTLSNISQGEQVYTEPLALTGDCTIEAWATRDGYTTSDTTRYEFAYTPVGVATYDGLVATVAGELTLDDAFAGYEGGREAAVQTIAAIVWDKDSKLTDDMLTGIDNPNLLVYVSSDELAPEGVQNVVVNGVCERLVLTDVETKGGAETGTTETGTDAAAGNGNFHAPLSFTALHAEYTHGYSLETPVGSNQGWETLALPFSVQAMTHETQGEIAPFAAMTDEGDTRKPFWLYGRGTDGTFDRAAQVEAYKPYLIAMPNNGTYKAEYLLAGRVTFSAENVTVEATPDNPDLTTHDYTFLPTLQRVERAVGVYALNIGGEDERPAGSVFISDSRDVLPFECYITLHDRQDAPRLLPIQDMMENATDMEDVRTMASRQSAGGGRHDLGGRRLQERQADRTATRKAARIVVAGGKKHVSRTR